MAADRKGADRGAYPYESAAGFASRRCRFFRVHFAAAAQG